MTQLATFLIFALVVLVLTSGVTAEDKTDVDQDSDLLAVETKITVSDGPTYGAKPQGPPTKPNPQPHKLETRPPSQLPLFPNNPNQSYFADKARPYFGKFAYPPYSRPLLKYPSSMYQFPRVITMPNNNFYVNPKPLQHVASSYLPIVSKNPASINKTTPIGQQLPVTQTQPLKHSIPVQTIIGKPSKGNQNYSQPIKYPQVNTTTSSTTTTNPTTTAKVLRTKRIWPKKIANSKLNSTATTGTKNGTKVSIENYNSKANEVDIDAAASQHSRVKYVSKTSTSTEPIKRSYRPVTRAPKHKSTTEHPANTFTTEQNDWVPVVPIQYRTVRQSAQVNQTSISRRSFVIYQTPIKRSDEKVHRRQKRSSKFYNPVPTRSTANARNRPPLGHSISYDNIPEANENEMMYMQTFGLIPMPTPITSTTTLSANRKELVSKPKRHFPNHNHNPYTSSHTPYMLFDMQTEESQQKPQYITKIKHHHHHHHHKYVKTVEKPIQIPYKVEVPKPYGIPVETKVPVPVEKIKVVERPVPYPVTVEKKVPYPVGIKVPQPVPVKVVEKEYIPKPYPIVHQVPVVQEMKVEVPRPYPVEKRVPYPVEVKVPVAVDRPVPVPVEVEKKVPYPVHVKVYVPQPYPVETKVPYPVYVKQPVEVIKHVKVNVPVPRPYPVEVKVPYPVEKKVPYPVEVEKRVPVPVEVFVPQRVEVEKKVPVYVPSPYPVEKRVPYPVKVPYPVRVPVKVPYEVPVYIHHPVQMLQYQGNPSTSQNTVNTATVHSDTSFQVRSDDVTTPDYSPQFKWMPSIETSLSNDISTHASNFESYDDVKRPVRALSTESPTDIQEPTVSRPASFQVVSDVKFTTLVPSGFSRPEDATINAFTDANSRTSEATTIASAA